MHKTLYSNISDASKQSHQWLSKLRVPPIVTPRHSFSWLQKVPRVVLKCFSVLLAFNRTSFVVDNSYPPCADICIGIPVLIHLEIDTIALLQRNHSLLNGTDCTAVKPPSTSASCRSLGHLLVAWLQCFNCSDPSPVPHWPRVDYCKRKCDVDHFPNSHLIDPD